MKFKIGELIRWYTEYHDGITKDGGIGIVLNSTEYTYADHTHTMYNIYRNKLGDAIELHQNNICKLKEK
tara:strand:+ start:144 stop:350 length:207 start_codon:yes stop_codon:yes gene_type:complete